MMAEPSWMRFQQYHTHKGDFGESCCPLHHVKIKGPSPDHMGILTSDLQLQNYKKQI